MDWKTYADHVLSEEGFVSSFGREKGWKLKKSFPVRRTVRPLINLVFLFSTFLSIPFHFSGSFGKKYPITIGFCGGSRLSILSATGWGYSSRPAKRKIAPVQLLSLSSDTNYNAPFPPLFFSSIIVISFCVSSCSLLRSFPYFCHKETTACRDGSNP